MSKAVWIPDKQKAEVEISKGKWTMHMGRIFKKFLERSLQQLSRAEQTDSEGGKLYIEVEEALFLVDQGILELYYQGMPMAFNQAVRLLDVCQFSWNRYLVYDHPLELDSYSRLMQNRYAHLKRAGYIVIRSPKYKLTKERDDRLEKERQKKRAEEEEKQTAKEEKKKGEQTIQQNINLEIAERTNTWADQPPPVNGKSGSENNAKQELPPNPYSGTIRPLTTPDTSIVSNVFVTNFFSQKQD